MVKNYKKILKTFSLILLSLFLVFCLVLIPIMLFSMPLVKEIKKTYQLSQETYQAIKNQNLVELELKIKKTEDSLNKAKKYYQRLGWTKFIPFLGNYYQDGKYGFQAAESGLKAGQIFTDSLTPYADVLGFKGKGSFKGGTAEDRIIKIVQTLKEVNPQLKKIKQELKLAEEDLNKINPKHYPKSISGKNIRENIIKIQNLSHNAFITVDEAGPVLDILPQILGYPDSKKYLVIMQNDGELRATGGFMTAYAVIKIESGKVIPEKSDDIYSLDKKNKNKVKAPEAIKKYLLNANLKTGIVPFWYLRDMNLSPDFKVSMETFKKYYDKLPGEKKVDGIIALDTQVLKDFLTILGPVEIPGYRKFTMAEDPRCHNIPQIVCELETIVDTPIPGIKQSRKDILGPLMKAILTKVFSSPPALWPRLLRLGLTEIKQKHTLFYFSNSKQQKVAEKLNAAGRIQSFGQDYLHINNSNFGGAKSNLFVKNSVEQKIEIDENNNLQNTLTLTYVNPEPMDNCNLERKTGLCLNGVLRNYFRIYVPKGSKLIEGLGSEVKVKQYDELDKTVFEGFFSLRGGGGRAKVIVSYQLPFKYNPQNKYQLLIQKQPGTLADHYVVFFGNQKKEFDLETDKKLEF